MKTQVDLISRVLGLLNVVQVGQDPAPEDAALVKGYIAGKFEELAAREVFYVQDADAIEERVFLSLAKIVANAVGPEFGAPYDADADAREEFRLRDLNRGPDVYRTMQADYI